MQGCGSVRKKENVPVYKFLKEPLIRKFGEEWYKELEAVAEELKSNILSKLPISYVCQIPDTARCIVLWPLRILVPSMLPDE